VHFLYFSIRSVVNIILSNAYLCGFVCVINFRFQNLYAPISLKHANSEMREEFCNIWLLGFVHHTKRRRLSF
jgi:hypothetical protein